MLPAAAGGSETSGSGETIAHPRQTNTVVISPTAFLAGFLGLLGMTGTTRKLPAGVRPWVTPLPLLLRRSQVRQTDLHGETSVPT